MKRTVALVALLGVIFSSTVFSQNSQMFPAASRESIGSVNGSTIIVEDIATGLDVPWGMVITPDFRMLVTERPGRVRVITTTAGLLPQPAIDLTSVVAAVGEGGLLGIEVDPNFLTNRYVYVYGSYFSGAAVRNAVVRLIERDNVAVIDRVLLADIPGGSIHNGGRIKIGPDNLLYVTTGDAGSSSRAQDLQSLGGKILRMNLDGTPAPGNPFPSAPYVYSYGHRNPQGLAWDSSGRLYSTEFGPTANDEVNIITPGGNYGWPTCIGRCGLPQFIDPIRLYAPQTSTPAGATFYNGGPFSFWNGDFFFGSLGFTQTEFTRQIRRLRFGQPSGTTVIEEEGLGVGVFGRIRDIIVGPDGNFYFSTSNRDGRGDPGPLDDRIIRARIEP